jgi:hypothetical protein
LNPIRYYAPRGEFLSRWLDLYATLRASLDAGAHDALAFLDRWQFMTPEEKTAKAIEILTPRFIGSDLIKQTAFITTEEATKIIAKYRGEVAAVVDPFTDETGAANFVTNGTAGAVAVLTLLVANTNRNRTLWGRIHRYTAKLDQLRRSRMPLLRGLIDYLDNAARDHRRAPLFQQIGGTVPSGLLIPTTTINKDTQ